MTTLTADNYSCEESKHHLMGAALRWRPRCSQTQQGQWSVGFLFGLVLVFHIQGLSTFVCVLNVLVSN